MWNNCAIWKSLKEDSGPALPAIHLLTYYNLSNTTEEWIKLEAGIDRRAKAGDSYGPGFTALYLACLTNRIDMVNLLLDAGRLPHKEKATKSFALKLQRVMATKMLSIHYSGINSANINQGTLSSSAIAVRSCR